MIGLLTSCQSTVESDSYCEVANIIYTHEDDKFTDGTANQIVLNNKNYVDLCWSWWEKLWK